MDVTLTSIRSKQETSASFHEPSNYGEIFRNSNARSLRRDSFIMSQKPESIPEEVSGNLNTKRFHLNEQITMDSNPPHGRYRRTSGRLSLNYWYSNKDILVELQQPK